MYESTGSPTQAVAAPAPAVGRRRFLAGAGLVVAGAAWAGTGGTALAGGLTAAPRTRLGLAATGTGFAVPVDTRQHTRTWMAWPDSTAIWGRKLSGIQANIALIAKTIAKYEPVYMCANSASVSRAQSACGPAVTVIGTIPVDDCWMRDT